MAFAKFAGFRVVRIGASCLLGIGVAQAKAEPSAHRHDGTYTIHIATQHGSCHKAYETSIAIKGAQVHATGLLYAGLDI
jgi:hypothetical protein